MGRAKVAAIEGHDVAYIFTYSTWDWLAPNPPQRTGRRHVRLVGEYTDHELWDYAQALEAKAGRPRLDIKIEAVRQVE